MSRYCVRYQVEAVMEYFIEAESAETAYRRADQSRWDDGALWVERMTAKEIIDSQGQPVEMDFEAVHDAIDEGEPS